MRVTREEIVKLAMRADWNNQGSIGNQLRYVASCLDRNNSKISSSRDSEKTVEAIEKNTLLEMREI